MFRSPQPGDWAAEDEDTPPLPTPTIGPVTTASSLEVPSESGQSEERSNSGGRFERDRNHCGGRFDREGGQANRDRDYDTAKVDRDRRDSSGGRFDRGKRYDRDNDRNGRYERDIDRNGRYDRDTDRSGRFERDTDRNGRSDRYSDRNGRFERDNGRYEGGGRADVSRWGHPVDRRHPKASRDLPLEQGFVVSIKDSFGFVSSLARDGDLFFHISEAPVDVQLQDEVEYRVKYNQRSEKEMACQLVALPKGTIQVEDVSDAFYDGIVTKSLFRGSSRGYYMNRDDDRRHREEFGLIEVKKKDVASDNGPKSTVEQVEEGDVKALVRRDVVRFTSDSVASVDTTQDEKHAHGAKKELLPHFGDEVRFKMVTHRKTGGKRAVELTITVSAREKLEKEVEAKLATMTREVGVVDRVKNGGGVIKCCDRPVDVYFPFHELRDDFTSGEAKTEETTDAIQSSGRSGKDLLIREGDEVSFFVYEDQEDDSSRSRPRLTALRVQKLPVGSVSFEQLLRSDVEGVVVKAPKEPRNGPEIVGAIAVVSVGLVSADKDDPLESVEGEESGDKSEKHSDAKPQKVVFRLSDIEDLNYVPHVDDKVIFDEVLDKRSGKVKAVKVRIVQLCSKNRETGVITAMKDEFGFIKCAERCGDAYFRFSDVMGLNRSFNTGTEVAFDVAVDTKSDHVRATRVQVLPRGTVKWEEVVAEGVEGKIVAIPTVRGGHNSTRGGRGDKGKQLQRATPGKIGFVVSNKQHLIEFLPELKQAIDGVFITTDDDKPLVSNPAQDEKERSEDKKEFRVAFPSTLSKFERAALHEYSEWLGLEHESTGEGAHRRIEVFGSDTISLQAVRDKAAAAAPELTVDFVKDDVDDVRYYPRVGDCVKFDLVLVKRSKQFQCKAIKCVETACPTKSSVAQAKPDGGKGEGFIVSVKSEGFGFIQPDSTIAGCMEENLFFHIKEITTGEALGELKEGTEVQFTRYFDEKKKKMRATAIRVVPAGTIKSVVPESVQGVVTKASYLHRMKGGAKSRFTKATTKASTVGRIRLATTSHDADDGGSESDDGGSDEDGEGETAEGGTLSVDAKHEGHSKRASHHVYLYNIRDLADPAVIVREGDLVEFIPQVTPKVLRAAHIRLVTSQAKQGVVTRLLEDQGGVIRLDGDDPSVEARFTARSVLRGDVLSEGDRVEFAYRHPVAAMSKKRNQVSKETDIVESEASGKEESGDLGQALSVLRLSSNRAAPSQARNSRTVNSTLKKAMRQIGANAMVASRMAKGPNGTRGFVNGWKVQDETETIEEPTGTLGMPITSSTFERE